VVLSKEINAMYSNGTSAEPLWSSFKTNFMNIVNRHVPHKTCRQGNQNNPWSQSRAIKKMEKRKRRLYKKAKQTKNWKPYNKFQKVVRRELRKAERDYITTTINESLAANNSKPFWNYVKRKKQDNCGVAPSAMAPN
jgi:hypothetical protein